MIKPINEYVNTLISARRYDIMNEKKIFGGLFDKKKKDNSNTLKNIKFIGSTDHYNTGDINPKNRTYPYNNIEDAAFSIVEACVSKDYCDNGYIILNKPAGLKTKIYIYKIDNLDQYKILSIEFTGTVEECIKEYNIPIKNK